MLDVALFCLEGLTSEWLHIERWACPACEKYWILILFSCGPKGYFYVSALPGSTDFFPSLQEIVDILCLQSRLVIRTLTAYTPKWWHLDWGETSFTRLVWWKEVRQRFWPSLPILVMCGFVGDMSWTTCRQSCFWHGLLLCQKRERGIDPANYSLHCINLWVALNIDM